MSIALEPDAQGITDKPERWSMRIPALGAEPSLLGILGITIQPAPETSRLVVADLPGNLAKRYGDKGQFLNPTPIMDLVTGRDVMLLHFEDIGGITEIL
jgi:hypothetical protein